MTTEDIMEKSDELFRLARKGRALADELDAMAHSLWAKAVELDVRERDAPAKGTKA